MRLVIGVLAFLAFAWPEVSAQRALQSVALKVAVVAIDPKDATRMILTLESGSTISVRLSDIDTTATEAAKSPSVVAPAARPQDIDGIIRAKCAKEWPTDFSVRAYCERTQREAVTKLGARTMSTADQKVIRQQCTSEWPDDFSVRNYCEETQLKALKELGR